MSRSFIDCKLFLIRTSASRSPSAIAELRVSTTNSMLGAFPHKFGLFSWLTSYTGTNPTKPIRPTSTRAFLTNYNDSVLAACDKTAYSLYRGYVANHRICNNFTWITSWHCRSRQRRSKCNWPDALISYITYPSVRGKRRLGAVSLALRPPYLVQFCEGGSPPGRFKDATPSACASQVTWPGHGSSASLGLVLHVAHRTSGFRRSTFRQFSSHLRSK